MNPPTFRQRMHDLMASGVFEVHFLAQVEIIERRENQYSTMPSPYFDSSVRVVENYILYGIFWQQRPGS